MFQTQRLQSDWNEQGRELCLQQFKGLDTLLPHPPITIQEDKNKATLLFITNKNNKTIMLLLNNDTMLITPNIIDEFNAVKAAFFTFLENKKHICVIDNKDNLYTTTC